MTDLTAYMQAYDAKLLDDAKQLSKLSSTAEIRAWFVAHDRPLDEGDNAYAAALGTLQAVTTELVRWIGRADV